jgi:ubiquinol-cytochrome c reductase cytochrome b subunit
MFAAAVAPRSQVAAASDAEKRGRELFATKGCAHCHGPDGIGGRKGPDLQLVRNRRSRESMLTQIHDGGKEMPPFGDELTSEQIDDLVAFLRAKRKVVVVAPKPAEPTQPGPAGGSAVGISGSGPQADDSGAH